MATLETIQEETPATSARVTADPPKTKPVKNPNRVAAGKRIAERNRRVRDVLDQMKQEEAEAASVTDSKSDTTAKGSIAKGSIYFHHGGYCTRSSCWDCYRMFCLFSG